MRKFPWKGVMEREKDHLGKWEVVVQAKDAGGWSRNETCGKED